MNNTPFLMDEVRPLPDIGGKVSKATVTKFVFVRSRGGK